MYYYVIPFLVYIFTLPLIENSYMLILRVLILLLLLITFSKYYKHKLKLEITNILAGVTIFLVWILLEGYYPYFVKRSFIPESSLFLFFRILSFVVITPIIEEFFTRNFLARILVKNDWQKVPLGKFTLSSFILIVLFFGFSHNRWLPGLIAGIILNYLIYKKREMSSVIVAHATANILLSIYIVYTKSWFFW